MEERLINAFMKLTAKVGAGDLVRELIQQVDENGNPKSWTPSEMEKAIHYINDVVDNFAKPEAVRVAQTLIKKFEITSADLHIEDPLPATTGVKGLQ